MFQHEKTTHDNEILELKKVMELVTLENAQSDSQLREIKKAIEFV